jgi:RNA polymerase sigma factor for flagellar operon FliA
MLGEKSTGPSWISSDQRIILIEKVISYLEHELGRESTPLEIAEKLQMPLEKYYTYELETRQPFKNSIDEAYETEDLSDIDIEQDSFYNPDNLLDSKEFIDKVSIILSSLPERKQVIFCLYFYEELSMHKIGLILKLGEARVSQLLHETINVVRRELHND